MKREERSKVIVEIKEEIDSRLADLDLYKIKDLILWLLQNRDYQKIKKIDEQLTKLDFMADIWRQEKSNMNSFEMQGDIFAGVASLEDIEKKYLCAKFAIWRIENNVPYEYCIEAIDGLVDYQYSAFALYHIVLKESKKYEMNLLKLARVLKDREQIVKAIGLLQLSVEKYPRNIDMILELANLWLEAGQLEKAYHCLVKIEEPTNEIQELKQELEKLIKDEVV